MRMLISGFSLAKELGTRANQKISRYNRIRVDGWKRFQYAGCGRENCRIRKKIFAEKNIPDTCGHGLKNNWCFQEIIFHFCNLRRARSWINNLNSMAGDLNEACICFVLLVTAVLVCSRRRNQSQQGLQRLKLLALRGRGRTTEAQFHHFQRKKMT